MRIATILAIAAAALGLVVSAGAATGRSTVVTSVMIVYGSKGGDGPLKTWALDCGAQQKSTHPQPAKACKQLIAGVRYLAGTFVPCNAGGDTEPFGRVYGTVAGVPVDHTMHPACDPKAWKALNTAITGR